MNLLHTQNLIGAVSMVHRKLRVRWTKNLYGASSIFLMANAAESGSERKKMGYDGQTHTATPGTLAPTA
jgi:hypothetical protein